MGPEINIESIKALEMQIEEGRGDPVKLKRARNSLLNISKLVPPELLGDILSWTLTREQPPSSLDFDGFRKGSYNFLLVCHYWFEVASHTPELWSFWGNTLGEWKKWHHRHPNTAPLDLVLYNITRNTDAHIDNILVDVLRDCAARDAIRQLHLLCHVGNPLSSIISSLTPEGDGVQRRSIESINIQNSIRTPVLDVSNFFARTYLPKLRCLLLDGAFILPPWDCFAQQTTLLTTLSLGITDYLYPPTPTTRQLFSILASNPGLQTLSLDGPVIPEDGGDGTPQVTLRHLKKLFLKGELRRLSGLLDRLAFPCPLNCIEVAASWSTVEAIARTLGPYLQQYFQCCYELQDRLAIRADSSCNNLSISVETEDMAHNPNPFSAKFHASLGRSAPHAAMEDLCHDFVSFIPRERVYAFNTNLPTTRLGDLLATMPNIEKLGLFDVKLSEGFLQPNPDGPHAKAKLLPSLRSLHLEHVTVLNGNWQPLTEYLAPRASDGQAINFRLSDHYASSPMSPEVAKEIEGLVKEFTR